MTTSNSAPKTNPGRSASLRSRYAASERQTDQDGTWLAHRAVVRIYGHGPSTIWRWSRAPGCAAIGEVLQRRQFLDGDGKASMYYLQAQLDRIALAVAAATSGADDGWLTQQHALERHGLSISTLYMLARGGRVRTRTGGRAGDGGKSGKSRVLFNDEDLAAYMAEHSPEYRPDEDVVTVEEAATILQVSVDSVRDYIGAGRFPTVRYAPSGSRTGPRLAVWLLRSEVEAEKRRRSAGSRLTPHVDRLGWRWLPVALAKQEYGLSAAAVNQHAHVSPSSWCLDGRRHFSDPAPEARSRRSPIWKEVPNAGRPGPTLKVYLEADLRVLAERLAGRMTADEAARAAAGTKARLDRGEGPDGVVPPPAADASTEQNPPRPRAGRPWSRKTEAVYKFCFDGRVRGDKLSFILKAAERKFGPRAPKEKADVRLYAKRFAERHGRPLPKGRTA